MWFKKKNLCLDYILPPIGEEILRELSVLKNHASWGEVNKKDPSGVFLAGKILLLI
jgi:hypothetical protein